MEVYNDFFIYPLPQPEESWQSLYKLFREILYLHTLCVTVQK